MYVVEKELGSERNKFKNTVMDLKLKSKNF